MQSDGGGELVSPSFRDIFQELVIDRQAVDGIIAIDLYLLDIHDVSPYLKSLDNYPLPLAAAYPVFSWLRIINGVHIEHKVEAEEILKVKQAVEQRREGLKRSIITYHLDKTNINRYKPETYEEIYHH